MATELKLAPNWKLVRDVSGAIGIDGTLNDTTHPPATAFDPGRCDHAVFYWSGTGTNAADTLDLTVLIRNNGTTPPIWVEAYKKTGVLVGAAVVLPVFLCVKCHIRVAAVSLAGSPTALKIWGAKLPGPFGAY